MTGVALVLLLLFGLFINRHLSIRALYGDDLYLWSFYGCEDFWSFTFPKVTKVAIVIDVDVKKHMYMAEVVANRLGEVAVGAKEFSESAKSVIDAAAARAERQLLRMRVKARKGTVRKQRAASEKN